MRKLSSSYLGRQAFAFSFSVFCGIGCYAAHRNNPLGMTQVLAAVGSIMSLTYGLSHLKPRYYDYVMREKLSLQVSLERRQLMRLLPEDPDFYKEN